MSLSIKDVVDVAGLPTTHSCRALAGHRATADAPIVRRFTEAGFVIVILAILLDRLFRTRDGD